MALQDRINRISQNLRNPSFLEEHGIEVKVEKGFTMANYGHTTRSDRYADLCRGTVFYPDGSLACLPLIRFFNLHEGSAANIDWRSALVVEKLDGSMIVAWYDQKGLTWRLSTKKMIDELPVTKFASTGKVDLAEKFRECFPRLEQYLDKQYWYVFECVFPENRIVTDYSSDSAVCPFGLYLLTMRHSQALQEVSPRNIEGLVRGWKQESVFTPPLYNLIDYNNPRKTPERIKEMFEGWQTDREGIVVVDSNFNRIKIKQASYVRLHHIVSNVSTRRNIIDLVLNGESYEVLSYFPEMKSLFDEVDKRINMMKSDIMTVFGMHNSLPTQKDFALAVKDLPYAPFLFRLRKGDDLHYQFMNMGGKRLEEYLFKGEAEK